MNINDDEARSNWEYVPKAPIEIEPFDMYATQGDYGTTVVDWEKQFEEEKLHHDSKKMGQLRATSIAGNDITSSCLYTVGLAMATAGKMAPFSLVLVAILLFLFRNVYSEVGSALPLNGGAYNVLLNTTSKIVAAFAAVLTILSYVATAVVSASEACAYLGLMCEYAGWIEDYTTFPVFGCTFAVLGFFAVLNLIGITESSFVALIIFTFHLVTLAVLIVVCFVYIGKNPTVIGDNWHSLGPQSKGGDGSYIYDIYLGFSASLLGVTGFESSANYIEEQKPGVFPKTLRNMWVLVAILNPTLSVLALGTLPSQYFIGTDNEIIVAQMGSVAGGTWLGLWVSLDAFFVLAGSVLTAYVGVTGLIRRMALDRCIPTIFLHQNPCRKTNHWIIIGFFAITSSLYAIVLGNVTTLSGMYSVAFLGVMALFAVGNMLLKYKRDSIPRQIRAHWISVVIACIGVILGLIGNIVIEIDILAYFSIYFVITFTLVCIMFSRVFFMRIFLYFIRATFLNNFLSPKIEQYIRSWKDQKIIFFAKKPDPSVINKAILYIRENEQTNNISIVHVYRQESGISTPEIENFKHYVEVLDLMYPKIKIELVLVPGNFNAVMVRRISKKLGVPPNFMFITCIDEKFTSSIQDMGGVRLITH